MDRGTTLSEPASGANDLTGNPSSVFTCQKGDQASYIFGLSYCPKQCEEQITQSSTAISNSQSHRSSWKINPAYVCLVEILAHIQREPYHWPVGRVTFQKIAYFATELGLPTGLHFVRGSYGPFSSELQPLITRLVNNGLIQEVQLGKMFAMKPGPTYRDATKVFRFARLDQSQTEFGSTTFTRSGSARCLTYLLNDML